MVQFLLLIAIHKEMDMDQDQRLERLKAEACRLSGRDTHSFGIDNLPPNIAEQFLQQVIAFEAAPTITDGAWHVDIPGDDAQATCYLTYYASERDRQRWREDFPDVTVPPHQHPAYDRDAALPAAVE